MIFIETALNQCAMWKTLYNY